MKSCYILLALLLGLAGCKNLEDAELSQRSTFIRFYEGANSFSATTAEMTTDGYIIAGTISISGDKPTSKMLVMKTDALGRKVWEKLIDGGSVNGLYVADNGYIIIGDSIQNNPDSQQITELENTSSRLVYLDPNGTVISDQSYSRKLNSGNHVDYHGSAVTVDGSGNLITLGMYAAPAGNSYAYVAAVKPNGNSLDTVWTKAFNYIERDYKNANAVYYANGNVLWATTVSNTIGNFSRSYLALPVINENSVFVNSDYLGDDNESQSFVINDLRSSPLGYGAVGTLAQTDGKKANMFFVRIDPAGNFKEETLRFFDGAAGESSQGVGALVSSSEDAGAALTTTQDGGYILAGTMETTPSRGNGGKDIWLVKVDAMGNPIWNKIIGGRNSEIVSSIRETADGGLLISGTLQEGTQDTGGLSSIFLIKTDKNGEVKD